jgi:hypothetical protein
MKCIHCQNDARYSERMNGKCPKCQRGFAFEPKRGDKLTDAAFQAAIVRVSSGGTVKWTTRHLYYEVARRWQRNSKFRPWWFSVLSLGGVLLTFSSSWFFLLPTVLFVYLAAAALPSKLATLDEPTFRNLWSTWLATHGSPPGVVVRRALPATTAPRALPQDIHHYSFDRAVVTDREETVDLLLANNFHFENNCAIMTASGYPAPAFETVRAMLRQNPKLVVYVLHDASVEGCQLAHRVRQDGWFQDSARIVDVGLSPRQAGSLKGCWQASSAPTTSMRGLTREDSAWLARYMVELAVIRPEQIIKRLFRAMTNGDEQADRGDGLVFVDSTSFSSHSGSSDGGGDSFG